MPLSIETDRPDGPVLTDEAATAYATTNCPRPCGLHRSSSSP
jgi:hypothetical protein